MQMFMYDIMVFFKPSTIHLNLLLSELSTPTEPPAPQIYNTDIISGELHEYRSFSKGRVDLNISMQTLIQVMLRTRVKTI